MGGTLFRDWGRHRMVAVFLFFYAVIIALTLNNTKPFKGDESFYITSGIRMVQTGSYLIPEYFGNIRLQKPILPYWITTAGYRVFGISLWSGRIPFLILAIVLLIILYRFSLELTQGDTAFGLMNVLVLASSALFMGHTRHAMCDLSFTLFSTLSLFWLVRSLRREHPLAQYMGACLWAGLACISKYLLGALPVVAFAIWLFVERRDDWKRRFFLLFHPAAMGILLLTVIPWYVSVWHRAPDAFIHQFMTESETITVSVAQIIGNIGYYAWGFIRMFFPFTLIAAYLVYKRRPAVKREYGPLLIYIMLVLLVFITVIARQRERYLLVTFPALTMVLGYLFHERGMHRRVTHIALAVLAFESVVFIGYPYVSGEQVKDLVVYWQRHGSSELSLSHLPRRKISWAQALSHGTVRIDTNDTDWVITSDEGRDCYPGYTVIRTNENIGGIRYQSGRLVVEKERYYLLKRYME